MIGRGLALSLLLGSVALAQPLDVALETYRSTARSGALGRVTGRAYEERRTPDGPDRPLTGTAVVLVPRSEAFLKSLGALRQGARDSLAAFRDAAAAVRRLREGYERALWEAGAPDLVRATAVGGEGAFGIDEVPAGDWILVATHSVFVSRPSPDAPARERRTFSTTRRLAGYHAVTVWVREIRVGAGTAEALALTDRNAWLTGVVEEAKLDAGD